MPTGYAGEGKTFSRLQNKWVTKKKERAFDYDHIDKKAWALLISFFRWFPDYFFDVIRSKNAVYGLEFIQRVMLRVQARYQNTYTTGARGLTKTFIVLLSKEHDGVFYPGDKSRYFAPAQKQSAALASQAHEVISECYPILANWWKVNNDRDDMFKISTEYGSVFTMYAPRGDNFSSLIGEEMAQEGDDGFDFAKFETDVTKGHRIERTVNQVPDRTRIQLKQNCISNASSRQNKAFTTYRQNALNLMLYGDRYEGFCMDIPWRVALLCNIRSIAYYKKEKATTTPEVWEREMEAHYTGSSDRPMVADEVLSRSRKLLCMEDKHCGDPNAIYVVCQDVCYKDGRKNAKIGRTVLKLTEYKEIENRDKYKAQVVYVDGFPPQGSAPKQATELKEFWRKYCMDGGQPTYLVIDIQGGYGRAVAEDLAKPTTDGTRPLSCYNNMELQDLAQKDALPIIYPMKSGGRGTTDPENDMIDYAQNEFEQGNVELLTSRTRDGMEQYKLNHDIKDDFGDSRIIAPYLRTDDLCNEIKNLRTKASGTGLQEVRKSTAIQRDKWSSLKYGLRFKQILEKELTKKNNLPDSSWKQEIERYKSGQVSVNTPQPQNSARARLLGLRRR